MVIQRLQHGIGVCRITAIAEDMARGETFNESPRDAPANQIQRDDAYNRLNHAQTAKTSSKGQHTYGRAVKVASLCKKNSMVRE